MSTRVFRIDVGTRIRKDMRTQQGGARIPAAVTRIGVFPYTQPDGTIRRELRLPEEVFNKDSTKTLETAAVTIGHPGRVTPDNWRTLSVGTPSNVRRDGRHLASDLIINDAATLGRVGVDLVECSCGYDCELEVKSGVQDGEAYDAIQRNIRYNHVGLGPEGWGRAGSSVRLRLDGADFAVAYTPDMADDNKDLQARLDAMTTDFSAVRAERDRLQARLDAQESELTKLRTDNADLKRKLVGAESADRIDARIKERSALYDGARLLHGKLEVALARQDGTVFSDREIMVNAIVARVADFKADGRSDDYVRARFDAEVDNVKKAGASLAKLNRDSLSPGVTDNEADPLVAAQTQFHKDAAEAHSQWMTGGPTAAKQEN